MQAPLRNVSVYIPSRLQFKVRKRKRKEDVRRQGAVWCLVPNAPKPTQYNNNLPVAMRTRLVRPMGAGIAKPFHKLDTLCAHN